MRKSVDNIKPRGESQTRNARWSSLRGFLSQLVILGLMAHPLWSQLESADLTSLSLEDLMNTKVTSVSKTEQKMSRTAAAVFVISAADILRSGATNIPDLLRMVPGIDVAQINANTWAITARAFNGRFSNKLLVMVDGRTVYSATFGGVFWDVLDLPLEDIEQIEVIRGPGGSIWGANAVSGVVNIITKKAAATKGGLVEARGGNLDQGAGTAQYGGGLGRSTDYRIFSEYFNQDHLPGPGGSNGEDGWHMLRAGFRADSRLSAKDTVSVQGNVYTGRESLASSILPSITSPRREFIDAVVPLSGGYLNSSWVHTYSARSDTTLGISFDRSKRDDSLAETRNTFEIGLQHHFAWGTRQDIVAGANYRNSGSDTRENLSFSVHPNDVSMQLFSLFLQDEIALLPDKLYLTVGAKLDHNYYTGFTPLPTARLTWTPDTRDMFWTAVARAERTPSESDTGVRLYAAGFPGPGGVPTVVEAIGNPQFRNEGLNAYEAGYRTTALSSLSIDVAVYYNQYDHQETSEPGTPFFEPSPSPPHLVLPLTFQNLMRGEAHGFEIAANWKISDRWTLSPGYALSRIHMHTEPGSHDTRSLSPAEGSTPTGSAQLRSHLRLRSGLDWDASGYFVNRLKSGNVASYTRLDTGLTWRLTESLSCSVVGQNLLRDRHLEYIDDTGSVSSNLLKRSAYLKLTWQF